MPSSSIAYYEVLSGEQGTDTSFTTPFYSAHPFHGFADIFGATPAKGLEDMSLAMRGGVYFKRFRFHKGYLP